MQALQFSEVGGPEVLRVVDVPVPQPAAGQIRISVRAAGVNPSDWMKTRAGVWAGAPIPLPSGVGVEASGIVDAVGEGVTDVAIGDAVMGFGVATVAEYAVLVAWTTKPAALPFTEAAGFPVAVETATRVLDQVGVQPGQTLLVHGAAGGVGSTVVQIARARGITVVGTASAGKHHYLRTLGALPTTYGEGMVQRVRALAPAGVHAAVEVAGSGAARDLIAITGNATAVLSITDGTAPQLGAKVSFAPQANPARALAEAARLFEGRQFRVTVAQEFPLAHAADAFRMSEDRHVTGKLVITIP